ncbi:acid protease [Coprinopsis marcescibilis]|uniref:Acid protease n=1 Tax=Coprinopsis marcescibilis TaxID=230819 RepID=A0A5C3L982_COPMA|nr:acid protease [Coprinopsis marcescibilis]
MSAIPGSSSTNSARIRTSTALSIALALSSGLLVDAAALECRQQVAPDWQMLAPSQTHHRTSAEPRPFTVPLEVNDLWMTTSITLGGQQQSLAVDTGGSDVWAYNLPQTMDYFDTHRPLRIDYIPEDDYETVSGTIHGVEVQIGQQTLPLQAFLNVEENEYSQAMKTLHVSGMLGLGLPDASRIYAEFKQNAGRHDATKGQTFLESYWTLWPQTPKYFALDVNDGNSTLSFGEYSDEWEEIENTPQLQVVETPGETRGLWNVAADDLTVDGEGIDIPVSQYHVSIITRYRNTIVPLELFDAIYSKVEGAVRYVSQSDFIPRYIVPCDNNAVVSFSFGGQQIPIHPLRSTVVWSEGKPAALEAYTVCINGLEPDPETSDSSYITLGSRFLYDAFALFNLGDSQESSPLGSDPYIQLLSKIESVEDAKEEASAYWTSDDARATLTGPMVEPSKAMEIIKAHQPKPSASGQGARGKSKSAGTSQRTGDGDPGSDSASAVGDSTQVEDDGYMKKYGPIALGLLGGNLVVGLVLVILGVMSYVKRAPKASARSSNNAKYVSIPRIVEP